MVFPTSGVGQMVSVPSPFRVAAARQESDSYGLFVEGPEVHQRIPRELVAGESSRPVETTTMRPVS